MKVRKIAISTGGGDAPGLNAVIRAVVKSAARLGWDWLDSERSWTRTGDTVVFEGARTVTATVAPGPVLPVPTCGQPLDQARKTTQTRSLDHIGL